MNNTFGTDAFTSTVEAEIEDFLIGMFIALFFGWRDMAMSGIGHCRLLGPVG